MANPFYTHSSAAPVSQTRGTSANIRLELDLIAAGFDAISNSVLGVGVESGTLNNFLITLNPMPTAYPTAGTFTFQATHANTGAATFQLGALTAIPLLANDGAALTNNYIIVGEIVQVFTNGTNAYVMSATKSYVDNQAFSAALPAQGGNAGKFISTNGTAAFWSNSVNLISLGAGTVAAPSLNFGDVTTGLFRPALNQVAVAINGVTAELTAAAGKTFYGSVTYGTGIVFPANMTPAQAQVVIGSPSNIGLGASGTWGINIYGNAASAAALSTSLAANGIAAAGANSDITSLTGPVSTVNGQTLLHTNDIVNGNFLIAQAGTVFTSPANGAYDLDGWTNQNNTSAVITVTQVLASTPGRNGRQTVVTTAKATAAAGEYVADVTLIEGYNIEKYVGNTFTLGFRARVPVAGIHCVALRNSGTTDRSYIAEINFPTANVFQNCSVTVVGGLPAGGTWNYTNGVGLQVWFTHMVGTSLQTTPNAWNTGSFLGTVNQVNDCGAINNFWTLEKVTLNLGTVAAVSEISYEQELVRCQRYFEIIPSAVTTTYPLFFYRPYKVSKRAIATVVLFSGTAGGADLDSIDIYGFRNPSSVAATSTAGQNYSASARL